MSHTIVQYGGAVGNRLLSPAIWGDCPIYEIELGAKDGRFLFDDFINTPALSADSDLRKYATYIDTSCAFDQTASEPNGLLRFSTDTTDNVEMWMQTGGNNGCLAVVSDTAGADKKLWFEARFYIDLSANGTAFVGLGSPGLAAADTITDAGALKTTGAFIGFRTTEADSDSLDFVFKAASQSVQTPGDGVKAVTNASYIKAGFVYDPAAPDTRKIRAFIDGAVVSANVSATDIAAATFPDAEVLAMLAGCKNLNSTGMRIALDWWAFAQIG